MNVENDYRPFVYIRADDTTEFDRVVAGWLELAEAYEPRTSKALLEGDWLAFIPDGTCFKEVSYKRDHQALSTSFLRYVDQLAVVLPESLMIGLC